MGSPGQVNWKEKEMETSTFSSYVVEGSEFSRGICNCEWA
jgi:hypothetical protein